MGAPSKVLSESHFLHCLFSPQPNIVPAFIRMNPGLTQRNTAEEPVRVLASSPRVVLCFHESLEIWMPSLWSKCQRQVFVTSLECPQQKWNQSQMCFNVSLLLRRHADKQEYRWPVQQPRAPEQLDFFPVIIKLQDKSNAIPPPFLSYKGQRF